MADKLTISRLARAAGVGVETVRYYQRRGLLNTPAGGAGYRRYGPSHVERLEFIRRAQRVGFTLKEIAELLSLDGARDHRKARARASAKLLDVEARMAELGSMAKALRHLIRQCEAGEHDAPCPIIRMSLA